MDPRSWIPGSDMSPLDGGVMGTHFGSRHTVPMACAIIGLLFSYSPVFHHSPVLNTKCNGWPALETATPEGIYGD